MLKLISLLFLMSSVVFLNAQETGDNFFDESVVHQIHVSSNNTTLLTDLFNEYLVNWPDNYVYRSVDITIDGNAIDSVGIRIKGGSTAFDGKSPLKLDFNEFRPEQEYDGITKVNLHNIYFDNSGVREATCYNILRTAGLKAPRTAYAEVFVNDQSQGLYLLVEQINKPFLGRYFADNSGVLYKDKGCNVAVTSDEGTLAEFEEFDQIMNTVTGDDLVENLEDIANVSSILQQILLQNLMNTADNLFHFGCNYSIYHEPKSSLLYWIPWDFNLSLYNNVNDYQIQSIINPYYDKLLSSDIYRQEYYDFACQTLSYNYNGERLSQLMDNYVSLIKPVLLNDPLIPFDPNGIEAEVENIKALIESRSSTFYAGLDEENFICEEFSCPIDAGNVVINEIVCSNDSSSMIADPAGSYPDWIELFNNTTEDIDLSDFYLSDDVDFKKHWRFPEGTIINGNDYLIIWADRDVEENGLHCDFKLSKAQGELFLMHEDLTIVDAMSYEEQTTNIGYARIPNGTGDFVMQGTSFSTTNEVVGTDDLDEIVRVQLNPNPVNSILRIESNLNGLIQYRICNDTGIEILKGKSISSDFEIATDGLLNGVYFIEIGNKDKVVVRKFVKME